MPKQFAFAILVGLWIRVTQQKCAAGASLKQRHTQCISFPSSPEMTNTHAGTNNARTPKPLLGMFLQRRPSDHTGQKE